MIVGLMLFARAPVEAQPAPQRDPRDTTPAPIATVSVWADEVWLALLDRDGSYFGRLAEEGTFQRFNPLMDDEYELDIWTGLYTGSEDARWKSVGAGFRAAGASVSHPSLLNSAEWRHVVTIAGPVFLIPRYLRQHSFSTRRDYLSVGVAWLKDRQRWGLRAGLGVHAFKASGDLELALVRRPAPSEMGLRAELRLALLDAFNNVVFDLAKGDPEQTPTHFRYRDLPLAARLDLEWASPRIKAELRGGISRRSRVDVTFPVTRDTSFSQAEAIRYLGALVEVNASTRGAVALYATTARAETDRRFALPSSRGFALLEETSTVGGRARVRLTKTAAVELDGRVTWRPERRVRGDGTTLRHADREVLAQAVIVRRPEAGWLWRLGIAYMDRRAGILAPQLDATNSRDLIEVGYRFRSAFELAFGLRWDLDGAGVFDGGHLRLAARW